jgi:hypothetical protein
MRSWGSSGRDHGEFREPLAVAADGRGHFYVADTYNQRIQKFRDP